MSTMKCARFPSKGAALEVSEVPVPTPGKGQVRVRVHACGVCHSDSFTQAGAMGNTFPRIPGHEAAGQVDEVGDGVKKWKKGDRVGLGWFGGNCGTCINCRNDDLVCCSNGRVSGIHFDGGYAQYVVTDENTLAHIPDDLSYEDAGPLMCAGVTVFNSMRNQGVRAGSLVAIQGVGGLGHLAIQYANKMGFKVVALSSGDDKAALAKELGAQIYINTSKEDPVKVLKEMGGAKLIVCTAPHAKAIEPLVKALAVGGKLLLNAVPHEPLSINVLDLISAKSSVGGWASGDARDSEDTMQFSVTSGVRAKVEVFPLEKAQEAYTRMMDNKARFRCVIQMPK